MRHAWHPGSVGRKISAAESGQAAVEFALIAGLMLVLFCMLVDFSRAIHDVQVMASLSREGSNLASRGTDFVGLRQCRVRGGLSIEFEQQRRSDRHFGHQHYDQQRPHGERRPI